MKDKEEYRNYMREYMKRRYHERRNLAIQYLGGKCAKCGSEERLEIDHIDRKSKKFKVDQLRSQTIETFWEEIKKCQLLCCDCHRYKTVDDIGNKHAVCGHIQMYKNGCRCKDCRAARAKQMREYRARKKQEKDLK